MSLKNIFNKLEFFYGKEGIFSVILVGSATSNKDYNDIDILIFVDNINLVTKYLTEFSIILNENYIICDDSYRFLINKNEEVSIVFQVKNDFLKKINGILKGKDIYRRYRNWTVGGFFPESLLKDIEKATLLWEDSNHILKNIQNKINKKKDHFFNIFSKSLEEEIRLKLSYYNNSYNLVFRNTLVNDLQIATIRLMFAKEKMFFPSLKRYNKEILKMSNKSREIINGIENIDNFIKNLLKDETFSF